MANEALIDRLAEVEAVYPGGMLHVEAANEFPIGMLVAPFVSAEEVVAGYERLRQLDVLVHSPHQYYVDFNVEARALKAKMDPAGAARPGQAGLKRQAIVMNEPSPPEPRLSLVGAVDAGGELVDVECAGGTIVGYPPRRRCDHAAHRGGRPSRHGSFSPPSSSPTPTSTRPTLPTSTPTRPLTSTER